MTVTIEERHRAIAKKYRDGYSPGLLTAAEIARLVVYRHDGTLPVADDAVIYFEGVGPFLPSAIEIQSWSWRLGRRATNTELDAACSSPKLKPSALGKHLRLTYDERTALAIKTIRAIGMSITEQRRRKREREKERARVKREEAGRQKREGWLAEHPISRQKPWDAEGVCRATWYNRRRLNALKNMDGGEASLQ